MECGADAIGYSVNAVLIPEVLQAKDLDSSVAQFILSRAEGLLWNDMGRFEIVT